MKAIQIAAPGGPDVLRMGEIPTPRPGPGEVLIRVKAAGVNRADLLQREGRYPPPPGAPATLGLEVAGEIAALGAGASRYPVGTPVCALLAGGGYAEYAAAPEGCTLPIPKGVKLTEAGSLPETAITVWANVFDTGALKSGETFLVHGGTSGIGVMATQLARALGATAYSTAGSLEKCQASERYGASRAINYRDEDFVARIKQLTHGRGVDLILDMIGGSYVARNLDALAPAGRHVSIATQLGVMCEIDIRAIMMKRLVVTGSTLRARAVAEKTALTASVERVVWPLIASGAVKPVVDSWFPLSQAAEAHRRMESSAHIGKILLLPG